MGVSETLLGGAGVLGIVIAMMVDGRRAVVAGIIAATLGMLPTVAALGPAPGLAVLAAAMVLSLLGYWLARRLALRLPWVAGLDPLVPAFAPDRELFGPRSVRAAGAAIAVPAASWVSFNVPIGQITAVSGVLFPMAYAWACGALRLVLARTVEDVVVGTAMLSIGLAATWLLRSTADVPLAVLPAAVAPLVAVVAGWLSGRHQRRPAGTGADAAGADAAGEVAA